MHTSLPKQMVKPCDTRELVNIHNTYLILVQGLVVQNYWMIIKQLFTEVEVNIRLFHRHWGE